MEGGREGIAAELGWKETLAEFVERSMVARRRGVSIGVRCHCRWSGCCEAQTAAQETDD